MKIASIIGARPQFIKSSPISDKLNSHQNLTEVVIHTGQHYDESMSKIFFEELGMPSPLYNLNINRMNYSLMIDKMFAQIKKILIQEKIDAVLVYGDTNSTLAGSLAASEVCLPIFHVEAGLRSFNRNMPEEKNRVITDHISSLLFCPSKNAVKNLKKENINRGVILSGDVMYDAFLKFSQKAKKYVKHDYKYILATIHRRENIESKERLSEIFENLDLINLETKIIMPLHPHTEKKIKEYKIKSKIKFIKPKGYLSLLALLKNCESVITDSGGLQKETYFAKKICIIVRPQTEWVELLKKGVNMLSEPSDLYQNYIMASTKKNKFNEDVYGNGDASAIIVKSISNFSI